MSNRPPIPKRPVAILVIVQLIATYIATTIVGPLGFIIAIAGSILVGATTAIIMTIQRDRRQEL